MLSNSVLVPLHLLVVDGVFGLLRLAARADANHRTIGGCSFALGGSGLLLLS